ncbi:hypothetical protein [Devosia sp.]
MKQPTKPKRFDVIARTPLSDVAVLASCTTAPCRLEITVVVNRRCI